MLETILIFHLGMLSSPYYVAGLYYLLGMCVQTTITLHFTRLRYQTLIADYGHTKETINRLRFMSIIFWPVSMWLGIKSLYERIKMYRRTSGINAVEEED